MKIVITESKRKFNTELDKFQYEKHKVFLFKEDFEKFTDGLKDVIQFIENHQGTESQNETATEFVNINEDEKLKIHSDVTFEDLG